MKAEDETNFTWVFGMPGMPSKFFHLQNNNYNNYIRMKGMKYVQHIV